MATAEEGLEVASLKAEAQQAAAEAVASAPEESAPGCSLPNIPTNGTQGEGDGTRELCPPNDPEAALAALCGTGILLPSGQRVVLLPMEPLGAVCALFVGGASTWITAAVRGICEERIISMLCDLTELAPQAAGASNACDAGQSSLSPDQRRELASVIVNGLAGRGVNVQSFFKGNSPQYLIDAICESAGQPGGQMFIFWLELSSKNKRVLHGKIFQDKRLALQAAAVGNLEALKALDFDAYDVCAPASRGCCGGKRPVDAARRHGHKDCVAFLDERKQFPPPLVFT